MEINIDILTSHVIRSCIKIHSKIGPGCFEKIYEELLCYELSKLGLVVERQVMLPLEYEGIRFEKAYKIDILVEEMLILELKCVHPLPPVYFKQIKTYLSLFNLKNGMIINFKEILMKHGIHRVFNNLGNDTL